MNGSVQCVHKIWALIILVQDPCAKFSDDVQSGVHPFATQQIHDAL